MRRLTCVVAVLLAVTMTAFAGDAPLSTFPSERAGQVARAAPAATAEDAVDATGEEPGDETEEAEAEAAEAPSASVEFSVLVTNRYLYRGLWNDEGTIVQASIDLSVPLLVREGLLQQLDLGASLWTSFSTGETGTGGDTEAPRLFTEVDPTLSLTATLGGVAEGFSVGISYLWFRYPNASAAPGEEIVGRIDYDDSSRWPAGGRFRGLSPAATLGVELRGQSDGGANLGVYLGFEVTPRFSLTDDPEGPTLAFPIVAGFSLSDYYEDAEGNDETFGYVELGPDLELPLGGREGGPSHALTLGLRVLLAGEHVRLYNEVDEPLVTVFVSFTTTF